MKKIALALLVGWQLTGCSTPFEQMWQGLATCDVADLHLDMETEQKANPLLKNYSPYRLSDGFAWYKVHESLHGLPVVGFLVPTAGYQVHALLIDTPIDNARRLVLRAYGSEFSDQRQYAQGQAPLLLRDPNNPKRVIIDCTFDELSDELNDEPNTQLNNEPTHGR
ncbi:MAG: hypothetical protein ACRDDA_00710 [Aeromonas sp.]